MTTQTHPSHAPATAKRPPYPLVLNDLPPEEADAAIDWSRWYVTDEDDMGSSLEQQDIIRLFLSCLLSWATERGWSSVTINSDVFFAWIPEEPLVRLSPDVFVVDTPPDPRPGSIQTWLPGHHPPRFALEIVSLDKKKDHVDAPERYARLGCGELVIFDPSAVDNRRTERSPLTVYRKQGDGLFARVYRGSGPAYARELEAWIVIRKDADGPRLRLARDEAGLDLVPIPEEQARAEMRRAKAATELANAATQRADVETQRADVEAQRAEAAAKRADTEAQARREAEACLAAALEELRTLKRGP